MTPRPRSPDSASLPLFEAPPEPASSRPGAPIRRALEPAVAPPQAPVARGEADILADLNDEQRAAVTHGEGPLLIVAGAGTGKTQVLTRRIAWLIATKRARPEEVLALTFTEKAAAEMEARVDTLVPYGFVGATLCTFHAFGDRMLREHAVELGLTTQLRVESDAEILVFLREHLFELGLERYLPLGRPDEHLRALVQLFDRARDEDVSPEAYQKFADQLAATADSDEARDRAGAEQEKARAYGAYQRLLHQHGRIDFGSQISLALELLRRFPYLRREYQDRYRYILVDEFQDTNHVQFELLRLLAGERRNVTVVGDDDQGIYRFRGARVENLLDFRSAFPDTRIVLLHRNYRSGQRILDGAHRLIRHNDPHRLEAREGLDKRLRAVRDVDGAIEHQAFRTASDEADFVAAEIEGEIAGGREPGEVAVIARTHMHLDAFASALRARGVPFQRSSARGLYARPEVQLCLNVLRSVANPDDGPAVFQVLGNPMFGVEPVDLAWLSARARRRNRGLLRTASAASVDPASELSTGSRQAIARFAALHRKLADSAVRRPTTEVLHQFADESGLLESLAREDTLEAVEQARNLNKLFLIIQRIGRLLQHDRVEQFIGHLDLLIEAGDDPAQAEIELEENAVHLLTAHNAKGLEFPVVFLVQLAEGRFPNRRQGRTLALPPELHRDPVDEKADHDREERRLFYVGMTRARDRLMLTWAADYGTKWNFKPSRHVIEALGLPGAPRPAEAPSAFQSIARFAPSGEAPVPELTPLDESAALRLSNQQIDDFLTCPLKYRYAHVLRIPIQTDPRAMFGAAIHHAIRVYLRQKLRGDPTTVDDALRAYEDAWSSEGFYTREHEERRLEEGRGMLRRFVEREQAGGTLPLAVEQEFRFSVGPTVIEGRFDRIDERRGQAVIVDYKTSDVEEDDRANERALKSLEEDQLGLYALAYAETRGSAPARAELSFVGSGVVGTAEVQQVHLQGARLRIDEAGRGIRSARFPARPDKKRCSFCPYSRFCPESALRKPGTA